VDWLAGAGKPPAVGVKASGQNAENIAALQITVDASVDVTSASNASTRTYAGVSDLCALGISACARMSMCPPRQTLPHKLNSVFQTEARRRKGPAQQRPRLESARRFQNPTRRLSAAAPGAAMLGPTDRVAEVTPAAISRTRWIVARRNGCDRMIDDLGRLTPGGRWFRGGEPPSVAFPPRIPFVIRLDCACSSEKPGAVARAPRQVTPFAIVQHGPGSYSAHLTGP
jgi:hypothetical protein